MNASTTPSRQSNYFLVLLAGVVHATSFAPDPLPLQALPFVQLVTLAVLFACSLNASSTRQALLQAWIFGVGNFATGLYWLYISMHDFGNLHPALAVLAVALLAAVLAFFIVAAIWLIRLLQPRRGRPWLQALLLATITASVWTLFEWLRGSLLTGFPWLNIAYAHVDGFFAGWAAILGSYAISWSAAFCAAALSLLTPSQMQKKSPAVALLVSLFIGAASLYWQQVEWAKAEGSPMLVRLVQGNVPQSQKFDPQYLLDGIRTYQHMSALPPKEPGAEPQIIVLPETVVPVMQYLIPEQEWQVWIDIAKRQNATLILGVPMSDPNNPSYYTNSLITIGPDTTAKEIQQRQTMQYNKYHLVPFGEFVPQGFRWFIDMMQIPLGEFARGDTRQRNFSLNNLLIAPNICYEDVFGEEIIRAVQPADQDNGANLLINSSNLAWFGDSWALRQHLQISRVRSMETARPMLRATNTGATAAIDHTGAILAMVTPNQRAILDVEIQGMSGLTPYVRWGNTPIIVFSLLVCALAGAGRLLRRRPTQD
ncbi:apolipoprotein N-acyltransferase [Paenalcaligenes sp. Me131]|uniref:apolipoprotein N-acyltransferase n=1 Tax=Paenalcaligenes sp. Me131 TaxID=3392636 RepID=UPI003D29310E